MSARVSADFGRGGMMTAENLAKLERLNKLREVLGLGWILMLYP